MYIPKHFAEERIPVLHEFIEVHPFAALVTMGESGLIASHIPMVLEREVGSMGLLKGHISRANPQWREVAPEVEALAIFNGPEHYITPTWYPEKAETGKVVPTWNYVAVHVYGCIRIVDDAMWLRAHLETLTTIHEAGMATPWKVSDAPEEYVAAMAKGIVGIEMAVTRIEGKWKASQNRPDKDSQGVAAGLRELGTPESKAMQALVEERRRGLYNGS
jgi:transcriptional regulator